MAIIKWIAKAKNGVIVGKSDESFTRYSSLEKNIKSLHKTLASGLAGYILDKEAEKKGG